MNTKFSGIFIRVGITLCLVGIFLPWEIYGKVTPLTLYGIQLFPRLDEYGGFELLMLLGYHIIATHMSPVQSVHLPWGSDRSLS